MCFRIKNEEILSSTMITTPPSSSQSVPASALSSDVKPIIYLPLSDDKIAGKRKNIHSFLLEIKQFQKDINKLQNSHI